MELELITPTQFIYQAAMARPEVPVAMGKTVTYKDIPLVDVSDTICWLCGGPTRGRGQPVSKMIKPTFTDRDRARAPQSEAICPGCCFCLSFRELRNYSIVATRDRLMHPTRPELKGLLLEPPEPPFIICIAESGQKWVHFKSEVAYSRDGYPVQMEETRLTVEVEELQKMLNIIENLYTVFTKEEIRTGQFSLNRIRQFGLSRFQDWANLSEKHRGTRLFDLALFVAQKREDIPAPEPEKKEEEKVCITTSIPKTETMQPALF